MAMFFKNMEMFFQGYQYTSQFFGVVVTFFAVVIALYLARRGEKVRLKAKAKVINDVNNKEIIEIEVANIGVQNAFLRDQWLHFKFYFSKKHISLPILDPAVRTTVVPKSSEPYKVSFEQENDSNISDKIKILINTSKFFQRYIRFYAKTEEGKWVKIRMNTDTKMKLIEIVEAVFN